MKKSKIKIDFNHHSFNFFLIVKKARERGKGSEWTGEGRKRGREEGKGEGRGGFLAGHGTQELKQTRRAPAELHLQAHTALLIAAILEQCKPHWSPDMASVVVSDLYPVPSIPCGKSGVTEAREMAQQLPACAALMEDQSSDTNSHPCWEAHCHL